MRKLWLTIFIAAFGVAKLSAQQTNSLLITPAFINQLADEAQANNLSLRAAEKLIHSAQENEKSIRNWEDPTIRVGRMAAEKSMRRNDGDLFYGVEQKLPLFGKPEAARRVAESETTIEKANFDLKLQLLKKDISIAAFQIALAERSVGFADEDLAYLETLLAVAEQRYEANTANQLEVLRLQNERSRRIQQRRTESVLVTNSRAQINRLIGRDVAFPFPNLNLPEVAPGVEFSERLIEIALRSEPNLKKLRREAVRAETLAEQARRERYPDFTVGVEARNYTGSGEFREGAAFVAFNFPWGNRQKYEADFQREKARQQGIELDAKDYESEVRNEIFQLITRIETARREALLYQDEIIPRTQLAFENARAAWEANAGNIIDLFDARRLLLDAQLMHARSIFSQYQMLSELVFRCGLRDLDALGMITSELSNEAQTYPPKK